MPVTVLSSRAKVLCGSILDLNPILWSLLMVQPRNSPADAWQPIWSQLPKFSRQWSLVTVNGNSSISLRIICIYIYVRICVYMVICMYIYICMGNRMCVYIYIIHMYNYIYIWVYEIVYDIYIYICVCANKYYGRWWLLAAHPSIFSSHTRPRANLHLSRPRDEPISIELMGFHLLADGTLW